MKKKVDFRLYCRITLGDSMRFRAYFEGSDSRLTCPLTPPDTFSTRPSVLLAVPVVPIARATHTVCSLACNRG